MPPPVLVLTPKRPYTKRRQSCIALSEGGCIPGSPLCHWPLHAEGDDDPHTWLYRLLAAWLTG